MLLAGDIGGTHARLSLYSDDGARRLHAETFDSRAFPGLEPIVRAYVTAREVRVTAACLAIAGPVVDGVCRATNLPWVVDARKLGRVLSTPRVTVVNDLVAIAEGALRAKRSALVPLGPAGLPKKRGGNVAVIAAGTGLGEAALVWDGQRHVALATEGSHADFAPRDAVECELLAFARARIGGRVSYERLVSGPAMGLLYDFFVARGEREPASVARAIEAAEDRNAAIATRGMTASRGPCKSAVARFVSLYGAEAGNLALKTMAVGGLFVAGNIATRMLDVLRAGAFMQSFLDKGRMRPLLEGVPVAVLSGSDHGLVGSAAIAAAHLARA